MVYYISVIIMEVYGKGIHLLGVIRNFIGGSNLMWGRGGVL